MKDDLFVLGDEHQVNLGASFGPSRWIGPLSAGIFYTVFTSVDVLQLLRDHQVNLPTSLDKQDEGQLPFSETMVSPLLSSRKGESDWWVHYYKAYDDALPLCRFSDLTKPTYSKDGNLIRKKPVQVHRVETTVQDAVSLTDEAKAKFDRDSEVWEVEIKAPQKNSPNWFAWHGLALPALVAAYAQVQGWQVDPFDISELTRPQDDVIVTDKFQDEMIGNTDKGYKESKLWKRRARLWAQLGEDNPKVSNSVNTESEQLGQALRVAMSDWLQPVYGKVLQLPSPRQRDTFEWRGRRLRNLIPVITDLYPSREAALAAYQAEQSSDDVSDINVTTTPVAVTDSEKPEVPEVWREIPDEWYKVVSLYKQEIGVRPPALVKQALKAKAEELERDYATTPEEVFAFWNI